MTALRIKLTRQLEAIVHWGLFGVSGVFSVRLFLELASTSADKWLYGAMACFFEGTKIVLWEIGRGAQRIIAIAMVMMSLVASTGAALAVADRARSNGTDSRVIEASEARIKTLDSQITAIDESIAALTTQARGLPADYVTAASRLQTQIAALYDRQLALVVSRDVALAETLSYEASRESTAALSMFRLIAKAIDIDESEVVLVFMLAVALLLEIGALGTTEHGKQPVETGSTAGAILAICKCGSKRTAVERSADGHTYSIVCRSCGRTAGSHATEAEARGAWSTEVQQRKESIWQRLGLKAAAL